MEKSKYEFLTPKLYWGLSADKAAAELERIRKKHGTLNPQLVVDESRPKRSVLHKVFQWDDAKAAELYRRKQAQLLMANLVVVVTNETVTCNVRALVHVSTNASPDQRSYVPIIEAIHDDTAYQDLLGQARDDMESFVTKYKQITELNPVKAAMLQALNQE